MPDTAKTETVSFTVKGQVVIPRRIRREFEIENGTKAIVQATPEGILLKPITGAAIKRPRHSEAEIGRKAVPAVVGEI